MVLLNRQVVKFLCLFSTIFWVGCVGQSLKYDQVFLAEAVDELGMVQIPFVTNKGRQVAFYHPARSKMAEMLVIVFPGIESRALDRLDWVTRWPDDHAAFLLLDYPGRGECEGMLQPTKILDTTEGALDALQQREERLPDRKVIIGHSFGCAMALKSALGVKSERVVLLAPFNTLHKALFRKIGPLAWLIPGAMDNRKMMRSLLSTPDGSPKITIIHGAKDASIPLSMGRSLHSQNPAAISFYEIRGGTHMSILTEQFDLVVKAAAAE